MNRQTELELEGGLLIAEAPPPVERLSESPAALVRDSLGYLVSKIVPGLCGLASVPVIVRLIGVDEYGRLAVLLPILLALTGAGSGWLQQGILRFHPGLPDRDANYAGFRRAVVAGTSYSVLILGFVMLPVLAVLHYSMDIWILAELYCVVILPYMVWISMLQAQLRPTSVIRNEAVRAIAGFLVPVILVLLTNKRSFSLVLLGLIVGYAIPLAVNFQHLSSRGHESLPVYALNPKVSRPILSQLWSFGWAVGIWLMLCQALPVVGRSAIQRYSGYAEAGIYASLYEIAVRSFSLFAAPVMQAAHPRIMRYWNQGAYAAARQTIRKAIQIQILIFLPVEAVGVAFSRPITRLILGPNSAVPSALLPLLMLGGFLWQIALFAHKPLEIMKRTTLMLVGMLIVLAVEVAGNYVYVPRFGVTAAVYVFVGGAFAYIAFAWCCNRLSTESV